MSRTLPLLTLGLALLGGAAIGRVSPQPLQAQEAMCSYGSDNVCREIMTCTRRSWNIGFRNFVFGLGPCVDWHKDTLYYRDTLGPSDGGPKESDADPADEKGTDEGNTA